MGRSRARRHVTAFTRPELARFAARERDRFERALKDFVEIPSVSADPARMSEVVGCAELGAATIRSFGGRAELHRVPGGNPIVLGSFGARPGRPTVTVYNHLEEKLTRRQIADFQAAGFSVKGFIKDHGFKSIRTRDPLEVMKRLWAMPTFEVHGLVGGYTGPGVKTIVPPRAELKASVRLVPNMKAEKVVRLVKAFVKKRNPDVRVEPGPTAAPYKGLTSGPSVEAAQRSMKFAFGKDPVFVRGRHERGRAVDGADPEVPDRLHGPVPARPWLSRPRTRTTTGARRAAA